MMTEEDQRHREVTNMSYIVVAAGDYKKSKKSIDEMCETSSIFGGHEESERWRRGVTKAETKRGRTVVHAEKMFSCSSAAQSSV